MHPADLGGCLEPKRIRKTVFNAIVHHVTQMELVKLICKFDPFNLVFSYFSTFLIIINQIIHLSGRFKFYMSQHSVSFTSRKRK